GDLAVHAARAGRAGDGSAAPDAKAHSAHPVRHPRRHRGAVRRRHRPRPRKLDRWRPGRHGRRGDRDAGRSRGARADGGGPWSRSPGGHPGGRDRHRRGSPYRGRELVKPLDAIIIGTGQAGPPLAGRLTAAGMKVAIIERKLFGGTCVNTGCTPTKALVASAYAAHLARRSADFGVISDGAVRVDIGRVKARADAIVASSRTGVERWLRDMPGCTVIQGQARFEAADVVRVDGQRLTAPRIFINVGGRALVPADTPGVDQVPYLTNSSLLALPRCTGASAPR